MLPLTNGLAASPDGRRVYAASSDEIATIDTNTNAAFEIMDIPHGAGAMAVNPNGKFLYTVAPFGAPNLTVISTSQEFFVYIVKEVPLSVVPGGIAISPNGRALYITDVFGGSLVIMDTFSFRSAAIPVNPFPGPVTASPDGKHVYVLHPDSNQMTVVDFEAGTLSTVAISNPTALAVTPDASRAYVTNGADNTVTAIDAATDAIVATIPAGDGPFGLAVSADGASVYVANQTSNDISVISTATNTVAATIPVGHTPQLVVDVVRRGPARKFDCMNGGWQHLANPSFKNEGDCIAFYNSIH